MMNTQMNGLNIELVDVSKRFGSGGPVVANVDLTMQAGSFVTLLGPSGSGKTTTLNMIAGLESVSSGEIRFDGNNVSKVPAHKRNLGMLFQNYALFPNMTVSQNVEYPLKERRTPKTQRRTLVSEFLNLVQLESKKDLYPSQLSGGQQQRVALARSIVFSPRALLLDEPLSALDKNLRGALQLEMRKIHREVGSTFIFVTHDQEEAMTLSDTIVLFREGGIAQIGDPETLYRRPNSLFAAQFLGESNVFEVQVDGEWVSYGQDKWTIVAEAKAPGTEDSPDGQLVVRPEHTTLTLEEPRAGLPRVRVEVVDVEYLGAWVRIVCRENGDGQLLIHRTSAERTSLPEIGDPMWMSWGTEHQRLTHE